MSVTTLSYKYRINPSRGQVDTLDEMLRDFCHLYNAALEHRIEAYRKGVSVKCYEQIVTLPVIRRDIPDQSRWSYTAQQQVLRRLDKSFQAFFGRVRRGAKAGFPRFRACARYHAADFCVGDGLTIRKSGRIGIVGVPGEIKVRWHRVMPSKPKSAIITRQAGKWFIVFHVKVDVVERAGPDSVGIDMGLTSLVALSNGEVVARPNWTKRAAKGLRRRQRAVARCKRSSKTRCKRVAALGKYHARIACRRRDFCHKLSRDLVKRFGRIAIEDLNIKGLARGMLAKHVNDAAWGMIVSQLRYKAANAGVEFVEVDPRGTSQTCPECRAVAVKTLATREHRCECGCSMDRDVAAAMVIHFRAFGFIPGAGIDQLTRPVAA
jgi:putative transposase